MLIVKISCEGKFRRGGVDRGCPCTGVPPVILNRVPRLLELFGVEATRCQNAYLENASCRARLSRNCCRVRARSTAFSTVVN